MRPVPRAPELADTLTGRRSVRAFATRRVPRDLIERAIEAAGWAPSPHGSQPWRFVVIEAMERRVALADAMSGTWRAQLALDRQDETVIARRLARSRERLERAPVLVLACLYLRDLQEYPDRDRREAEVTMAIQSLGAAVQNFLLAIYQAGLDSGWMCAPLFCPEIIRDTLDLSADLHPHALLPVGHAAADPKRRPRRSLDELIVDWH